MMRRLILTTGLIAPAGFATAQDAIETPGATMMSCSYTTECLEQEACTFAQFGHEVDLPQQMPGKAVLQLGTGPAEGTAEVVNGVLRITASDGFGNYMLTQTPEGLARLSVHFAAPLTVVTYHGSCEVTG